MGDGSSFLARSSGAGLLPPTRLALSPQQQPVSPPREAVVRGSARRRGLLAACSTPRSSTPQAPRDATAQWPPRRPLSALLDGLTSPEADTLSGGVSGRFEWPVTQGMPEPVNRITPPHLTHARR